MKSMLAVICALFGATLADTTYLVPKADAEVRMSEPDTGFGSLPSLAVWLAESGNDEWRSFMRFDLGDLPPGTLLDNAALFLTLCETTFEGGYLAVYNVVGDWSESSITWNNQPGYDTDEVLFHDWIAWEFFFYIPLDVSVIQEWIDNPQDNEGMVFKTDPQGLDGTFTCMSRETDGTPELWLSYEPAPVEFLSWGVIKATEW